MIASLVPELLKYRIILNNPINIYVIYDQIFDLSTLGKTTPAVKITTFYLPYFYQ
jgi:hypothetical protein